jgi:hypothetical protein
MLIVLIFVMVGLMIAALAVAPAINTAIKRDKEVEMVHRGVEYARAIKKYYKKFGRYPANLEALEDTNHMRFLRKRYKDPFSEDGKWQLVRFGQVQMNAGQRPGGGGLSTSGQPGLPNITGVTGMLTGQNPQSSPGQRPDSTSPNTTGGNFGQSTVGGTFGQSSTGGTSGQSATGGTSGQPTTGDTSGQSTAGGTFGQSSTGGGANQQFGGGAIIGVSSTSPRESLRVIDNKNHYKDWKFIYDPTFDRGGLIRGPYDPKKQLGQFPGGTNPGQQIGQPIGSQQQGTGFNNNNSSFGQPSQGPMQQPYQPPDLPATPK